VIANHSHSYNDGMNPAEQAIEADAQDAENSAVRFSFRHRVLLFLISSVGALLVRLIGRTLRVSATHLAGSEGEPLPGAHIYCFWHRCILPATYHFRNMQIGVMTSRSFDGEYIARIIEKFGFVAIRGSSSRGALGALRGMHRHLESGNKAAFTIDGPRGPRYVAKPGPIMLARSTGLNVVAFYLAPESTWVLNTWDQLLIPKPFTRVHLVWAPPVHVHPDSNQDDVLAQMQAALELALQTAEVKADSDSPQRAQRYTKD
jgi:lysophospholipid acyltransferase (LPLAT)-like uncharacterized protein